MGKIRKNAKFFCPNLLTKAPRAVIMVEYKEEEQTPFSPYRPERVRSIAERQRFDARSVFSVRFLFLELEVLHN